MDFCQQALFQAQAVLAAIQARVADLNARCDALAQAVNGAVSKFCPGSDPASINCCNQWRNVAAILNNACASDAVLMAGKLADLTAAIAATNCAGGNVAAQLTAVQAAVNAAYAGLTTYEGDVGRAYAAGATLNPSCPCNTPNQG